MALWLAAGAQLTSKEPATLRFDEFVFTTVGCDVLKNRSRMSMSMSLLDAVNESGEKEEEERTLKAMLRTKVVTFLKRQTVHVLNNG